MDKAELRKYIKLLGVTQSKFAETVGAPLETVHTAIKAGKFGNDLCRKILKAYPQTSAKWLLTGEGEMFEIVTTEDNNYFTDAQLISDKLVFEKVENVNYKVNIPKSNAQAYLSINLIPLPKEMQPGDIIGISVSSLENVLYPESLYLILTKDNKKLIRHILPPTTDDDYIYVSLKDFTKSKVQLKKENIASIFHINTIYRILQ